MINSNIILKVPQQSEKKNELRKLARDFYNHNPVSPPLLYSELYQCAGQIILKNNLDQDSLAFLMVCCGNEMWRNVFSAVPYNRRILLLPECLKNNKQCKASKDEFGLLCAECGNCNLSEIINLAENLGYLVLVTEGTTITSKIIEKGNADVIIGVGCLDSLQKIYQLVNKYSIPSIGIPLETEGCIDTKVDIDWLKSEIEQYNPSEFKGLVKLNNLKQKIRDIFTKENIVKYSGVGKSETEDIAIDFMLSDGQRLRPIIAVMMYEAVSENAETSVAERLAISIECFHKASLIHDDIEDYDLERYGKQTIHAQYGIPIAINVGDMLIGMGYSCIAGARLSHEKVVACIKVVSNGHIALSKGQGAELLLNSNKKLLAVSDVIDIYRDKTSAAFRVALLTGAIAGGAGAELIEALTNYSNFIGIAYQIKDDIQDYKGNNGDICSRGFSILLSLLNEAVLPDDVKTMKKSIGNKDYAVLTQLFEKYKVEQRAKDLLVNYLEQARRTVIQMQDIRVKLALLDFTSRVFHEYL